MNAMSTFNFEQTDKEFYVAKMYLDTGRYRNAIAIYDKIIDENYQFLGNAEAELLLETSLNNRGCAKCGLARINRDRELYLAGIQDFEKSIEIDKPENDDFKEWLTAYKNLKASEEELKTFEEQKKPLQEFRSI